MQGEAAFGARIAARWSNHGEIAGQSGMQCEAIRVVDAVPNAAVSAVCQPKIFLVYEATSGKRARKVYMEG